MSNSQSTSVTSQGLQNLQSKKANGKDARNK